MEKIPIQYRNLRIEDHSGNFYHTVCMYCTVCTVLYMEKDLFASKILYGNDHRTLKNRPLMMRHILRSISFRTRIYHAISQCMEG